MAGKLGVGEIGEVGGGRGEWLTLCRGMPRTTRGVEECRERYVRWRRVSAAAPSGGARGRLAEAAGIEVGQPRQDPFRGLGCIVVANLLVW